MSGKTTAARYYSRAFCARRVPVVVFDPVGTATHGGGWGDGAIVYSDLAQFEDWINSDDLHPCKLFIDEASAVFGHEKRENFWLAERGRHYGIQLFTITQRPMRIHPTVRDQHGECFMFRLKANDTIQVGADYGHDLREIDLDAGEYVHLISGQKVYNRGSIFPRQKAVKTGINRPVKPV